MRAYRSSSHQEDRTAKATCQMKKSKQLQKKRKKKNFFLTLAKKFRLRKLPGSLFKVA